MTAESIDDATMSHGEIDSKAVLDLARKDPKVHEGELEIDDNAVVSYGGDNGAYVQAWLWVDFAGTSLDEEGEDESEEASAC